jgi:hypothetical protein
LPVSFNTPDAKSHLFGKSPEAKSDGLVMGKKQVVVVDEKEQKLYDAIVVIGGGKLLFDSPDRFHYLAQNGNNIYLVEETLKPQ